MRTLNRYILADFFAIFAAALGVVTLVLYIGTIMKGLDYIAQGVPGSVLMRIFTLNIPYVLTFSIPISTITATLLLFGRLSMDGEITAMRAGGLSTWQIVSPVILASLLLSVVCLIIHYEIAPESRFARRQAFLDVKEVDPVMLLDEGRYVNFPGMQVYVTRKTDNRIEDVEVHLLDRASGVTQKILADRGVIHNYPETLEMKVVLYDAVIIDPDPNDPGNLRKARVIPAEELEYPVDYSRLSNKNKKIQRAPKSMRFRHLMECLHDVEKYYPDLEPAKQEARRMDALVEAHKRIGLAMTCFSFAVLGIPLGIKSRRKESSIGIVISLIVVVTFYSFMAIAESLAAKPQVFPELFVWIPVIGSQVIGFFMMRRMR